MKAGRSREPSGEPAVRPTSPRSAARGRRSGTRAAAAQATREAILRAATRVFAKRGYDGGRIDQISRAARSYDRMIYYYFGSKEGLYVAVIEDMYRRFNDAVTRLTLDPDDPEAALAEAIRFVWAYYQRHPEFITLLNDENLHRGRHLSRSPHAGEFGPFAMNALREVLDRGAARGLFRRTVTPRDLYLLIAALGYFYLSNRYTLSAFFGERTDTPEALAYWERFMIDAVRRTLAPPEALPPIGPR